MCTGTSCNSCWPRPRLLRLFDSAPVRIARELVCPLRLAALLDPDPGLLLSPALIYRAQAPLGARPHPDRLVAYHGKYRIRMRRRQYPQRYPTAAIDFVIEADRPQRAVGGDLLPRDGGAVHDQLQRNLARVANSGPLQLPVRL